MIRREVLQSLTEDEMGMLLHMTRVLRPPGFGLDVNENILTAYQKNQLIMICRFFKQEVLPEHHSICDNLIAKLDGSYKEVTDHDNTDAPKPDEQHNGSAEEKLPLETS